MTLLIGLIKASLPSYFPDRHGVFDEAEVTLRRLAGEEGASVAVAPIVPMNGAETREAMDDLIGRGANFVILLHGGFTMGDVARTAASYEVPLAFWATPEPHHQGDIQLNNFVSLNMSMSIARGVRDFEADPVRWYFGAPNDTEICTRLRRTIKTLSMRSALRRARVAAIGGLAPTFYNMSVQEDQLFAKLGVVVEHVDMHDLTSAMKSIDPVAVADERNAMAMAADIIGVSDQQMDLTARMVLALRQTALSGSFDALAVSDWPALQHDPGFHPGAAFSWLEENDRLPVASEGDVMGAVTQLAAKALTGKVGCLLDMTSPQLAQDRILMWHGGGGPLYLAQNRPRWINHPMIGRGTEQGPVYGAIADYCFAQGPVSIVRLGLSGTNRFSFEAEVVEADETGFTGCRGWLSHFSASGEPRSAADVTAAVLNLGVEHHFVLLPGRWDDHFDEFSAWCGLDSLTIPYRHTT